MGRKLSKLHTYRANLDTNWADIELLGGSDPTVIVMGLWFHNPDASNDMEIRVNEEDAVTLHANAVVGHVVSFPCGDGIKLGGTDNLQWRAQASTINNAEVWIVYYSQG